jgi:serine/threonine protein kinase
MVKLGGSLSTRRLNLLTIFLLQWQNVGFDKDGVLKMFDFGLAKELKDRDETENGMYNLTGNTGSRRYMPNEVALDEPYNKSVDAYSFGILLWEMCAAETPFHGYTSAKHMELVVIGGQRPSMDPSHTACWPMNLQWLMNRCWSASPADRPTFTAIKKVLREVLECNEAAMAAAAAPSASLSSPSTVRDDEVARGALPSSLKPLSPTKGRSKTWGFMKRS